MNIGPILFNMFKNNTLDNLLEKKKKRKRIEICEINWYMIVFDRYGDTIYTQIETPPLIRSPLKAPLKNRKGGFYLSIYTVLTFHFLIKIAYSNIWVKSKNKKNFPTVIMIYILKYIIVL